MELWVRSFHRGRGVHLSIAGPGSIAVADGSCPGQCCSAHANPAPRACAACRGLCPCTACTNSCRSAHDHRAKKCCPSRKLSIDRCTPRPRWKDAPRACDGRMHHAPAMDGCTPRPRSTQPVPAMRPTGRVVMCVGRCEFEPLRSRFSVETRKPQLFMEFCGTLVVIRMWKNAAQKNATHGARRICFQHFLWY